MHAAGGRAQGAAAAVGKLPLHLLCCSCIPERVHFPEHSRSSYIEVGLLAAGHPLDDVLLSKGSAALKAGHRPEHSND